MSLNQEWEDKPAGYYADNKIKTDTDKRQRENQRFNELVEQELLDMGCGGSIIPTESEIKTAKKKAERRMP